MPVTTLSQFQVDAFVTDQPFSGNPAAVCPLEHWLDDDVMQSIAEENNLSETAFFVPENDGYRLRWFTPTTEVNLCGHATLASAHVLFEHLNYPGDTIVFHSLSGKLLVTRTRHGLTLDFPAFTLSPCEVGDDIHNAMGMQASKAFASDDLVLVFEEQAQIEQLQPDMAQLKKLPYRGIIVTAQGAKAKSNCDFVARFFAPAVGVDEDPVTGSAYTKLAPYWGDRLGKTKLHAKQLSKRGGDLYCELDAERVLISGKATTFLTGSISF